MLQSFNELQLKPLGEYKIKIVDLLSHLVPYLKNISKFFDEILIENEFFKKAFDYLIEYEWNNIYQNSLLSLLKILLDEANDHQLIHDHLFNTLKIYEIIKKYTNKEDKFKLTEEISLPITHGYYSFFISLSYKINTVVGGTPIIVNNNLSRQGSFLFIVKVPEEGDKKGAVNMLYGGFDDMEANDNNDEKDKEEKKCNYDSMKSYITDDWRDYFGLNIEEVIKQYEDRNWPAIEKKEPELPFDRALDNNENENDDNEMSNRDKNIFGDDDNEDDNNDEDKGGRRGVVDIGREAGNFFEDDKNQNENENVDEDPFKKNDVNLEAFEFDDKDGGEEKENKEEKDKKEEINPNEVKIEDKKPEEDNKEENKLEEVKNKEEEKKEEKIEEKKKEEEKTEDNKKEEEKKEEVNKDIKKEEKQEDNKEEKKEEKVETDKKEEEKKETQENKGE